MNKDKTTLCFSEMISIIGKTLRLLFHIVPKEILKIGVIGILTGIVPLFSIVLSKIFLDSLARGCLEQKVNGEIVTSLLLMLFANSAASVLENVSLLVNNKASGKISIEIDSIILEKCVHLPMKLYDDSNTYNKIRFTAEQTSAHCVNLITILFSSIQCLAALFSTIFMIVYFNGTIVLIILFSSVPLFLIKKYVSGVWYKISTERVEKQRYTDLLRDIIIRNDNIKELKLFASLSYLKEKIVKQQNEFFIEDQINRKKFCKMDSLQNIFDGFIVIMLKMWIIVSGIKNGSSIGTISLCTNALDQIKSAVISCCAQVSATYEQALYLNSLFEILEMEVEKETGGLMLEEPVSTIEFRHVSFSYPNSNTCVLKDVSFFLNDRHTYALVGMNGSGKTTLLKLLMKLYEPTTGNIYINGRDISTINTSSLRCRMSAIFQDFIKFPFNVHENVTISDIEKRDDVDRLRKVLNDVDADEFINRLPNRLDTQLQKGWRGGTELSQGQWQKLAIARCLFRKGDIYLFDEPFSSLDAISEQSIIQKIGGKEKNSITVFITHRYSSLRMADYILVLKDGKLVEKGTHKQLQKDGSYYDALIRAQINPIEGLTKEIKM